MRTRFAGLMESPDANEGTLSDSNYSTERSPTTALLFEAKRNVVLPRVRLHVKASAEKTSGEAEVKIKVGCSAEEH